MPVVVGREVPKEGCLWHLPFRDGIADEYFSTRWFVGEYRKRAGNTIVGVKDLMEKAATDVIARSLFFEFGQNLATCLAVPLQNFGAGVLVIGGNIAHALPLFENLFRKELEKADLSLKIAASKLMENAALIGSARLLDDAFWKKVSKRLSAI